MRLQLYELNQLHIYTLQLHLNLSLTLMIIQIPSLSFFKLRLLQILWLGCVPDYIRISSLFKFLIVQLLLLPIHTVTCLKLLKSNKLHKQCMKPTTQRNLWRILELKQFKFEQKDLIDLHNLFPKNIDHVGLLMLRNGTLHKQLG